MYAFYKNFAYCLPNCFFALLSGEVIVFMMCVKVAPSSCSTYGRCSLACCMCPGATCMLLLSQAA